MAGTPDVRHIANHTISQTNPARSERRGREWSGGRRESGAARVPTDYCRLGAAADEVADVMQSPAGHVNWREETEVGGDFRRAPGRRATWRSANR